MRSVRFYPEAWPLHTAFVISRGSRTEARVVAVEIEENGIRGVGECTPYARYDESEASVMAQIASVVTAIEQGAHREQLQHLLPAGAARNALDSALWNLETQTSGLNLWQLTGTEPSRLGEYGANRQHRYAGRDGRSGAGIAEKGRDAAENQTR